VPLGLLSGGTANLLVKEMGIHGFILPFVSSVKENSFKRWTGESTLFALMAGIGFDSEIVKNVDWNVSGNGQNRIWFRRSEYDLEIQISSTGSSHR
jgi:diacylglycerol kinase family enzyme